MIAQRRASPHLLTCYLEAVAALFGLMGWQETDNPQAGTRQWRPAGAGGENVCATLRPQNGGAVDLRAGALNERRVVIRPLLGRLVALAACDHGRIPEPTPEARRLAALACLTRV